LLWEDGVNYQQNELLQSKLTDDSEKGFGVYVKYTLEKLVIH